MLVKYQVNATTDSSPAKFHELVLIAIQRGLGDYIDNDGRGGAKTTLVTFEVTVQPSEEEIKPRIERLC